MPNNDEPMIGEGGKLLILPYGNPPTSGHAGSDTSEERARTQDADGTTRDRQAQVLRILTDQRETGATWRELSSWTGAHHGAASGALSNLHRAGLISRLAVTRNKCKVYVLPEHVGDRLTEPAGRTNTRQLMDDLARLVHDAEARSTCDHLPGLVAPECWNCAAREALRHYNSISGTSL